MDQTATPVKELPPRAQAGQTVLLVEDEPAVRRLLVMALEAHGYTVVEAADGSDALDLLPGIPQLDLLVTDLGLIGGITGRQLADAARAIRPGLKVLLITGYAGGAAGTSVLEPGMQLMTKPFTMGAFSARIRAMIAQT